MRVAATAWGACAELLDVVTCDAVALCEESVVWLAAAPEANEAIGVEVAVEVAIEVEIPSDCRALDAEVLEVSAG